jgi:hypothetical protein
VEELLYIVVPVVGKTDAVVGSDACIIGILWIL